MFDANPTSGNVVVVVAGAVGLDASLTVTLTGVWFLDFGLGIFVSAISFAKRWTSCNASQSDSPW